MIHESKRESENPRVLETTTAILLCAAITTTLHGEMKRWKMDGRENNLECSLLVLIYFFSFIMMYDNQCHSLKGRERKRRTVRAAFILYCFLFFNSQLTAHLNDAEISVENEK